jgi:hypothetical protein
MQPLAMAALGVGTGIMIGIVAGSVLRSGMTPAPKAEPIAVTETDEGDDNEALLAANANLVSSLQECNRRLADVGQKRVAAPAAQPTATASNRARGQGQGRRETTGPDWERYAKQGVVPYNVPCLRETPFTPSQRQLDRLGLAPHDATVLQDAYKKSNERVMAQLKPLCAKVLGNAELADRVGASACTSAIVDSARKENPDKMREALARVAEVNAGKRAAPDPAQAVEPVEALMLAFTGESKAFEADLAAAMGPEDARRIASSRTLCSERGVVRARPDAQQE